jgi:hypothetical protein
MYIIDSWVQHMGFLWSVGISRSALAYPHQIEDPRSPDEPRYIGTSREGECNALAGEGEISCKSRVNGLFYEEKQILA